jgi:hypothetical protein
MINWKPKSGWLQNEFPTDKPVFERVEFELEMRQTNDGDWKIINKCEFRHRGLGSR